MKIAKKHSHLNGEEWLIVHEKDTYQEILDVIQAIDAEKCRTKISKEKTKKGQALYSPVALNAEFDRRFSSLGWESTRYSYYVAHNFEQLEAMANMSLEHWLSSALNLIRLGGWCLSACCLQMPSDAQIFLSFTGS